VYAAARLHNSISVFHLSTEGALSKSAGFEPLKFVQRASTNGLTPRCLCMSECGKFIIVAHQHSHDIASFQRNEGDGRIAFIDRLDVPNAACVKLIRPDAMHGSSLL
jgi:6-phosphogluconolactonase (cycloisomerase 2 family)